MLHTSASEQDVEIENILIVPNRSMRQAPRNTDHSLAAALLIYIGIIIFISFRNLGPVYLSDEIGYAAKAAHLAGHSNLLSSSWHAGYSLAMAPLFKIFGIGPATWTSVSALNLSLLVLSIIFWISTLKRLGLSTKQASWISISSLACYGVWGFTGWLFANPMLQLIIAMLSRWLLIKNNKRRIIAISLTGGLAYWVHPTGALIAGCAWLATILNTILQPKRLLKSRRSIQIRLAWITAGILLTLGLALLYKYVHRAINTQMGGDGGHYSQQIHGYITAFSEDTLRTSLEFFTGFINGAANLSIATFGYGILLVASLIKTPYSSSLSSRKKGEAATQAFTILATISLLAFGAALSINMENNYQHMMHQRYISPMIQSLWILGITHCMASETPKNLPARIVVAISPIFLAIATGSIFWSYDKTFSLIDLMSSGSSVIANRIGSQQEALSGLCIGAFIVIAVQTLAPHPKLICAGVIAAVVGFESNLMRGRGVENGSTQMSLAKHAHNIGRNQKICLAAVDTPLSKRESANVYEFYLSSASIQRIINRDQEKSDFNSFFNPNTSDCHFIIAPLGLAFSNNRSDIHRVINKLSSCHLTFVDSKNDWGLYECNKTLRHSDQDGSNGFTTIDNNVSTGPLPIAITPLIVYTSHAFRHEKSYIRYARIVNDNHDQLEMCGSLNIKEEIHRCRKQRSVIVSSQSDVPILWGIYIDTLKPDSYKVFMPRLKVLRGSIAVEVIDENLNRLSSKYFGEEDADLPLDFNIPSGNKRIEIRIQATKNSAFTNPSHIIISK